jgi:uncharacterized protein (DUF927 family)
MHCLINYKTIDSECKSIFDNILNIIGLKFEQNAYQDFDNVRYTLKIPLQFCKNKHYITNADGTKTCVVHNTAVSIDKKSLTCDKIKRLFNCEKNCQVKSPLDLYKKMKHDKAISTQNFNIKSDGLYYHTPNSRESEIKICFIVKVLNKTRNRENSGWARIVRILSPDGIEKNLEIPMKDISICIDKVMAQLADEGVEFNPDSKAKKLFNVYLTDCGDENLILTSTNKTGWLDDQHVYILPNQIIKPENMVDDSYYYNGQKGVNLYKCEGTLEDWKNKIGMYCKNNSLLVLLTSYMLTGPLLKHCSMEGGGLHLYGSSSTGKTTCAYAAGSVCGGGTTRGYVMQWRTTSNAIEATATSFNDGTMILDELGQATSENVSQIAYMLPNSQGKERMKADGTKNKSYSWRLNFLSTGEMPIVDKIEETGKIKALVGQEVRIIEIPIDAGDGSNAFDDLHGLSSSNEFSIMLEKNSKATYGSPLRAFLECLCNDLSNNGNFSDEILSKIDAFVNTNCPSEASGQVRRVARKFGLMAVAGELAINYRVFPYDAGEAMKSVEKWFKIWLNLREGIGDKEILKAISSIKEHFAIYSETKYVDTESEYYIIINDFGQFKYVMLMLMPKFNSLIKNVNKNQLKQKLAELAAIPNLR